MSRVVYRVFKCLSEMALAGITLAEASRLQEGQELSTDERPQPLQMTSWVLQHGMVIRQANWLGSGDESLSHGWCVG
jgi:hypothetical protein